MSEIQLIEEALTRTARRRRRWQAWNGLCRGAFVGALLWFLALAAYKLLPIPAETLWISGIVAGCCALAGSILGFWKKPSLLATAHWVDERQQLKERLSTALESSRDDWPGHWKDLVVQDAARHADRVNPRALVPFHLPSVMRWALLVLVLGIGLGFVPEYRTEAFQQAQEDATHIKEVGKKLAELTRQNLEKRPPILPTTEHAMEEVATLGDTLDKVKLSRSEALQKLTSAAEKLREEGKNLAENPAMKSLERSARESSGQPSSPAEMQRQMDALQKSLGQSANDPKKLDDMQQKLQDLQQRAANMPTGDSESAQAAREQMAQTLADMAREAREMGVPLPDLEQALAALQNNQTDLFLRDMQMAQYDLEKLQAMAKAMQQLQQQASKLGKDLAEQLKNGQAQAAQQTLQKMISQLQNANLSPDQLERIMKEVAQAVDPAGEYGKVADHLQQAAQQMQQGQKPGAAESLAEAKKELEKLMQQLADAQALQEAMEALERAQMAIASGKSWEECQGGYCNKCGGAGCAMCRGKSMNWGHGGKPGSGVGTWADENGWTFHKGQQEPVDNSGIVRPDMAGREHADRPENLNENLNPTKVRGQMSPGKSMPSISLKGVHMKGESNIEFEEAAAAAQVDAQSAVNQDKVPRPYLNSVRDYFDDLKE